MLCASLYNATAEKSFFKVDHCGNEYVTHVGLSIGFGPSPLLAQVGHEQEFVAVAWPKRAPCRSPEARQTSAGREETNKT